MKKTKTLTKQQLVIFFGLGILLTNTIILYYTFLSAFFNGHTIMININSYGEAWLEFFFYPATIILGLYVIYYFYKTLPTMTKGEMTKVEI